MLNIILPSLPYQRLIDPMWQAEMEIARQRGYLVCLFDAEQEKLYQQPNPENPTLYRGWMLSAAEYRQLDAAVPLLVSPDRYAASHKADGWYEAIADYTPQSSIVAAGEAKAAVESCIGKNGRCFVKSLSKSFGAESVLSTPAGLEVLLQKHEIALREMLFVREFVELSNQPEQRFFVVRNEAFGAAEARFPKELHPALDALKSRWFYTVDVAYLANGQPVIIEVGDGQVSDTKEWDVADLYSKAISRLAELATA